MRVGRLEPVRKRSLTVACTFGAAGIVRAAHEALLALVEVDLVVYTGPRAARRLEAEPDLDALGRLHAHQGMRQPAVELAIPLGVTAETGRQPDRDRLDHAAERVARLLALVDAAHDAPLGLGVGDPHRRLLRAREDLRRKLRMIGDDTAIPPKPAREPKARAALRDPPTGAPTAPARAALEVFALREVYLSAPLVCVAGRGRVTHVGIRPGPGEFLLQFASAVLDPDVTATERFTPAHAGADLDLVAPIFMRAPRQ